MLIHTLKKGLEQAALGLSRHRIDLLSKLLPALIQTRSVNLKKLACALSGFAQVDSHYRRLQRFFNSGLSPSVFTQLILNKLVTTGQAVTLVLDRTHWKWGKTHLNLLCLGLLYQGVSIPLISQSLQRAGNSHTRDRKRMIPQALTYLSGCTGCLLADREFIGKKWLQFLLQQKNWTFVIRIRCNSWVSLDDGQLRYLASMTRYWKRGATRTFFNVLLYKSLRLNLVVHRPKKGDPLLLVTNRTDLDQVTRLYGQRWSIETAFGFLKSKGFHLEETRLTHPDRLLLLMGVLTWTLLWCLLIGLQKHARKAIRKKKHGRRAISLFRLGLDQLQQMICNPKYQQKQARKYARCLLSWT
jgi:hypothetical protein